MSAPYCAGYPNPDPTYPLYEGQGYENFEPDSSNELMIVNCIIF